jgi:hypothetical protein
MELLVFRASDSFSAPTSPILLPYKLIDERVREGERGREREREGGEEDRQGQCLRDPSDGGVGLQSLRQLLGSNRTNIIRIQADR